tara:strand:- start:562 stop:837 length:276 start_codon:yes stop_codon:yes gene_type:complete
MNRKVLLQANLSVEELIAIKLLSGNIVGLNSFRDVTDNLWHKSKSLLDNELLMSGFGKESDCTLPDQLSDSFDYLERFNAEVEYLENNLAI